MAQSNVNELNLNSLLLSDDLSSEEREGQLSRISEYLERPAYPNSVGIASIDRVVEITVDDSFVGEQEFEIEKITSNELFDILREDSIEINSDVLFPRLEQINDLFWFLHHLAKEDIKTAKVSIANQEELSLRFYQLVEAAIFFGFLETVIEDEVLYLIPTEIYDGSLSESLGDQYLIFLKSLASNESISESLVIQLNDTIFDRISKQMIHNVLAVDENIKKEDITNEDIEDIIIDLRYWYLGIKKVVLES